MPCGLERLDQRRQFVSLAGQQIAVRSQDDVAQIMQRLQIPERRFSHDSLRIIEREQEQALHRYGARIWSAREPGSGFVAEVDLKSVFWKSAFAQTECRTSSS